MDISAASGRTRSFITRQTADYFVNSSFDMPFGVFRLQVRKEQIMSKAVLIDGLSILNRAFYGIPDLTNSEGLHTNAVYGFLNIMFKILDEEHPDYLGVAFDVSAPTFRHKMFGDYKGTRKAMPDELRQQIPVMKDVLAAMNIKTMEMEGYEADDIIGTLCGRCEAAGHGCICDLGRPGSFTAGDR